MVNSGRHRWVQDGHHAIGACILGPGLPLILKEKYE